MQPATIIEDLYNYNDWANGRIFKLATGLTDQQLDQPREMGFGSLRATLFHMLAAEQIWLERWLAKPWRTLATDPQGKSLLDIEADLVRTSQERRTMLASNAAGSLQRIVHYRDAKGNRFQNPLDELLMHVANHGVHHRAQALNYLKRFSRTVPAGLDYIFYRLARPTVTQEESTTAGLRAFGLEIASGPGVDLCWDADRIARYYRYHDWAVARVLKTAQSLDSSSLDALREIGLGSIRKTLIHLHDAEVWWLRNWTLGTTAWENSDQTMPLEQLEQSWNEIAKNRNSFIATLDNDGAQRIVTVVAGGPQVKARVIESMLQLCCHGTHHRAQLANMFRHSGANPLPMDYIVWVRETA